MKLFERIVEGAIVIGIIWICLTAQGCGTVSGIGNDIADACNGYSIQAGRRAAAQQAYEDGRNGIEYGK
jgi:predicted small secreted protein